jgi:formylglycine-generating enzyme required for sulfatase activity
MSKTTDCLIQQANCGRIAGEPVCPKCGIRADVRYVSQEDMDMALAKSTALYLQNHAQALESQINKAHESPLLNPEPLAAPMQSRSVGQVFQDLPISPQMVVLPNGSFWMGDSTPLVTKLFGWQLSPDVAWNAIPKHQVAIAHKLAMGRYPVTFDEWDACVAGGGVCQQPQCQGSGRGKRPVTNVSWDDAQAFAAWLNTKLGMQANDPYRYRLPSEAEWEYACRAGSQTKWCFGDDASQLKEYAWNNENTKGTPMVGQKKANAFGLYDMHGAVHEWVEDCYHKSYSGAPSDGSAWVTDGEQSCRVTRGNAYDFYAGGSRSAVRGGVAPGDHRWGLGFRLARTLP